jgi:mono/diheme cytochrome c family protein
MPVRCTNFAATPGSLIAGLLSAIALLLIIPGPCLTSAQQSQQSQVKKTSNDAKLIARGKYIVEGVAGCGYCHTPRDKNGEPDRTKWLAGAPVFHPGTG